MLFSQSFCQIKKRMNLINLKKINSKYKINKDKISMHPSHIHKTIKPKNA